MPAARCWRIAFVDSAPLLVERVRASLAGGPFVFVDMPALPPRTGADLAIVPAGSLDPAARGGTRPVPVIAYGPPALLRTAFLAGCADYLRDPWTPQELALRAEAVLARVPRGHAFAWGVLRLRGCSLRGPGAQVTLTAVEARILEALLAARGRPVPREALTLCAMGGAVARPRGSRALDVHVSALRRKVRAAFPAAGPRFITAARGEGYLVP